MSEELWTALRLRCENCRACPLSATRKNLVLGTGSRTADLMFVGEAPGEQEDLEGIPFVGKAGQLLDRYLFAVHIAPDIRPYRTALSGCNRRRPSAQKSPMTGRHEP